MSGSNYIVMYSGAELHFLHPDPEKILLSDIAHHLAQINRFSGGLREPYNVADHSVYVMDLFHDEDIRKHALFHDASEAYLNDVIAPLKNLMPGYKAIEKLWKEAIATRFGLNWTPAMEKCIKTADGIALLAEMRDLGAHEAHLSWPPIHEAKVQFQRIHAPDVEPSLSFRDARSSFLFCAAKLGYDTCEY